MTALTLEVEVDGVVHRVALESRDKGYVVHLNGRSIPVDICEPAPGVLSLLMDGRSFRCVRTVTADENYLRECILNPGAKRVKGFQPIMPTFQGLVSEEQVNALVAYVKSLSKPAEAGTKTADAAPHEKDQPVATVSVQASAVKSQVR